MGWLKRLIEALKRAYSRFFKPTPTPAIQEEVKLIVEPVIKPKPVLDPIFKNRPEGHFIEPGGRR